VKAPPQIARYRLRERLGSGGAGEVWSGLMEGPAGFRKQVAVKLVEPGKAEEEVLRREARLGALMRHGNLVDVYQLGRADDGRWFLAMELVPGPTLREVLRTTGALPGPALRDIAVQLCRGLAYAHQLRIDSDQVGLVHRDIKASNVLLDPSGMVKLSDFGIARLQGGEGTDVQGTPGYIAPEQLEGAPPDPRADVYSMGVLLWAMAIGRPPLRPDRRAGRKQVLEVARGAAKGARAASATLAEALPGLEAVVARCVDPDPARRYADGKALGRALRALPEPAGPGLLEVMARYEATTRSTPTPSDEEEATHTFRSTGGLRAETQPLLGREREVSAVERHLEPAGSCITLKGLAGVGKSHLAHHVAHRWLASARPTAWAELEGASDLHEMLARIAEALRLTESTDAEAIAGALASRTEGLLVLDGIDTVVDQLRPLVTQWRAEAPWLRLLLTGSEVLGLADEVVVELGPLAMAPARELFRARQRDDATQSFDDAALDEALRTLDGLPLAIELAATHGLDAASTGSLVETLRGTWAGMPPWARHAMVQITAFRGAFLVEAAESLVDVSRWPDAPWPVAVVDALWSRSLLHVRRSKEGQRLGMFAAVRDFIRQQEEADEAVVAESERRHGAYFARFGDEAWLEGLQLQGGEARARQMARDIDDLVAACRRALARGDAHVAEATCLAAWEVLRRRGPLPLAVELLSATLKLPDIRRRSAVCCALAQVEDLTERYDEALGYARNDRERGQVLAAKARHQHATNQLDACVTTAREALRLGDAIGDPVVQGRALVCLGVAERKKGQPEASESHLRDAITRLERVGCLVERSYAWLSLGNLYNMQNRVDDAEAAFHKARRGFRTTGMRGAMATALANLTLVDRSRGTFDAAERRIQEALALHRSVGDRRGELTDLSQLAGVLTGQGRLTEAADALQECRLRARDAGMQSSEALSECNLGHVLTLLSRYEQAVGHFERSYEVATQAGIVWLQALALGNLGIVASEQGDIEGALAYLDRALPLARQIHSPRLEGAFLHERERALLARGEADEGTLHQAEALLLAAQDATEAAKVRCTRARLLARRGRIEEAKALLADIDLGDRQLSRRVGEARAELEQRS
jgi:tetratricopeptide (TPR) repeat protein